VTAFLYSGLAARPFWMTAILAPRFLASAFASGPSLLILLCLIVRRVTSFDPGKEAIQKLAEIVTYGMAVNVFFVLLELFTAIYSNIPEHLHHFSYLYLGLEGHNTLRPWMWTSSVLALLSLLLLLSPRTRHNERTLTIATLAVLGSLWIDKGLGMVITGFVPSPLGHVTEYWPTRYEAIIALAIYALGALVLTVLYKIATAVRQQQHA
jgi:molybdopterin-containing oxidoreductase family membrane subunit